MVTDYVLMRDGYPIEAAARVDLLKASARRQAVCGHGTHEFAIVACGGHVVTRATFDRDKDRRFTWTPLAEAKPIAASPAPD